MIYTIGYAGTTLERFIEILQDKHVSVLIDVRSLPKSRYFYLFNDTNLSKSLKEVGIKYENYKHEFGARQDNAEFYTDGVLDYEKFAESDQFQNGLAKVLELSAKGEIICLLCAEIDPINCHRAVLCARELVKKGLDVEHIIAKRNGETLMESHANFENRLLQETKVNNLDEAYRKQSKKIGYKLLQK